jgi:hypothetical protein
MDYSKNEVDEVLSQVEQEFEKALGSIAKSEEEIETVETEATEEVSLSKSEESEESEEEITIEGLYGSMTKSEKEAHYSAVKKSLFGEEEEEESLEKSESEEEEEVSLEKSESEVLKTENEELKKSLDTVNELLEKMFNTKPGAPKRKSITESYDVINKSEEETEDITSKLSKNEIVSKLKKLDYSSLEKNERDAINEYCLDNGSVEKIKHLIKE